MQKLNFFKTSALLVMGTVFFTGNMHSSDSAMVKFVEKGAARVCGCLEKWGNKADAAFDELSAAQRLIFITVAGTLAFAAACDVTEKVVVGGYTILKDIGGCCKNAISTLHDDLMKKRKYAKLEKNDSSV